MPQVAEHATACDSLGARLLLKMDASNPDNEHPSINSGNSSRGKVQNINNEKVDDRAYATIPGKDEMPTLSNRILIQLRNKNNYKLFVSEIMGTALLMYFVCGVSMGQPSGNISLMDHAVSAALGIMVIIFMFGPISGAHVNPAVSFGFACVRRLPWPQVPIYISGQVIGAVLGTLLAQCLFHSHAKVILSIPYQGVLVSFFAELLAASLFMFLACSVASNAQVTGLFASVAVAASIATNIIVEGPLSGASMNPARSLAPALLTGYLKHLWLYLLAPFVGAGLGAAVHHLLTH